MKRYICKHPGCQQLIEVRGTYCQDHAEDQAREDKARSERAFKNAKRSNSPLYKTARWREIRQKAIAAAPFCSRCGSTESLQVHHIEPPRGDESLFFSLSNLQVICQQCHRAETAREIRERKGRK